jgi:hypothetical protein
MTVEKGAAPEPRGTSCEAGQANVRIRRDGATQPLRAMFLLGINAGLGNSDVANLRMSALDLDNGRLD